MEQKYLQVIRLEIVELIDKTEELLTLIKNVEGNLQNEVKEADPLEWFDFTIVLDRLAVSTTMLHDKMNSMGDTE